MSLVGFNPTYYLNNNPDVAQAVADGTFSSAAQHYEQFGKRELSRDPNEFFDSSAYASNNEDVLNAVSNGVFESVYDHFIQFGVSEDRPATPDFDPSFYLNNNDDVAQNYDLNGDGTVSAAEAFDHFVSFGASEGREPASDGGGFTGDTFTLTRDADNVAGTANDDLITGFIDENLSAPQSSLNLGDTIDGGDGVDTLKITSNGDGDEAAFSGADISNVERLQIVDTDEDFGDLNLNGRNFERVELVNESDGLTADNVALGTGFKFTNTEDSHTINFTGASGSSDSAGIEINGTADGEETDVTAANIETVNLRVSSNSTLDGSTFAAATSLVIDAAADLSQDSGDTFDLANGASITASGAGSVNLGTLDSGGDGVTVDASAMTGGLTAVGVSDTNSITSGSGSDNITSASNSTAVSTGDGDDTVDIAALDYGDGAADTATVEGGGGRDTVNVTASDNLDADFLSAVSGFEVLDVGGANGGDGAGGGTSNYDVSIGDFDEVTIGSALTTATTISGITDEDLTITDDPGQIVTYALDDASGSSDSLSVTIDGPRVDVGSDGDTSNDENDLTVLEIENTQAVETINLVSNTAEENEAGDTNTVTTLDTNANTVNVSGNHTLTIGNFDDEGAGTNQTIDTIDASGSAGLIMGDAVETAGVSLIGSDSADTLLVGDVAGDGTGAETGSTINAGGGGDTITLDSTTAASGAADTIIIESGDSKVGFTDTNDNGAYNPGTDDVTHDVISGFNSGEDTIDVGSFNFSGSQSSGLANPSVTEAQAVDLVDGDITDIADFFVDTGTQRGVAITTGDFSDVGGSGTDDTLVAVDSNGDGNLNVQDDEVFVVSGTALGLSDFGF